MMTVFTTAYSKGDVILIPFPFSDLTGTKKRPALVLAVVHHRKELICMMLTSTKKSDTAVDVPIINIEKAGLLNNPTYARISKIFTITERLVIRKLGELEKGEVNQIIQRAVDLLQKN